MHNMMVSAITSYCWLNVTRRTKNMKLDKAENWPSLSGQLPEKKHNLNLLNKNMNPTNNMWQSIDTAPKDGTYVLACIDGFYFTQSAAYAPNVVYWDGKSWTNCDMECGSISAYEPTHWMPLPTSPSGTAYVSGTSLAAPVIPERAPEVPEESPFLDTSPTPNEIKEGSARVARPMLTTEQIQAAVAQVREEKFALDQKRAAIIRDRD